MGFEKIMDATKQAAHVALGTALIFGCLTLPGMAQNQPAPAPAPAAQSTTSQESPALGDYARKVRKEDQNKAKPKVYDNDNLPREDNISVVGTPAPEGSNASGEANATEAGTESKAEGQAAGENKAPAKSPEEEEKEKQALWKEWQQKLSVQRDQINLLSRELDVLQREYQIRAATFYADVGNRLRNSAAWDKQDADYKQQIGDKQKALADAKQKLDDMDEQARKAGVPASMREP